MIHLAKQPLAGLCAAFSAGIVLAHYFPADPTVWIILALFAGLLGGIFSFKESLSVIGSWMVLAGAVFLGAGYMGVAELTLPASHIAVSPPLDEVAVVGRVVTPVEVSKDVVRFDLDVKGVEVAAGQLDPRCGRVRMAVALDVEGGEMAGLVPGALIRGEAVLEAPRTYDNPGGFDLRGYLGRQGIFLTGFVGYPEFLSILQPAAWWWPDRVVWAIRGWLGKILDRWVAPENSTVLAWLGVAPEKVRGLSNALLLGARGGLDAELRTDFQVSGLFHLLAISGLHVGIIAGLLHYVLLLFIRNFKARAAAVFAGVASYGIITGFSPSVARAVLIIGLYLGAKFLDRKPSGLNILASAAFILLILDPRRLFDIGFQLTFVSTLGILTLNSPIGAAIRRIYSGPGSTIISVSIAAQLATAPLTAFYFNRIGGWSFIPYIPLAPLVAFSLASGVGGLLLMVVPVAGRVLLMCHGVSLALMIKAACLISKWPGSTLRVARPHWIIMVTFIMGLVFLAIGSRIKFAGILILVLAVIGYEFTPVWNANDELIVNYLDVGNGDAILIQIQGGDAILIDAGGLYDSTFDLGQHVVAPALRALGVRNLAVAVVTHPHPDHQNGMKYILEDFQVGELWVPSENFNVPVLPDLLNLAKENNIHVRVLDDRGIFLRRAVNLNNRSLILGLKYGSCKMLFPGDAEVEAEENLLRYSDELRSDVLKIGHHGSRTSTSQAFLSLVNPTISIIPCGWNNRFGHPHEEVLHRLKYHESVEKILRSDFNGMVTVRTDGQTIRVTARPWGMI